MRFCTDNFQLLVSFSISKRYISNSVSLAMKWHKSGSDGASDDYDGGSCGDVYCAVLLRHEMRKDIVTRLSAQFEPINENSSPPDSYCTRDSSCSTDGSGISRRPSKRIHAMP